MFVWEHYFFSWLLLLLLFFLRLPFLLIPFWRVRCLILAIRRHKRLLLVWVVLLLLCWSLLCSFLSIYLSKLLLWYRWQCNLNCSADIWIIHSLRTLSRTNCFYLWSLRAIALIDFGFEIGRLRVVMRAVGLLEASNQSLINVLSTTWS